MGHQGSFSWSYYDTQINVHKLSPSMSRCYISIWLDLFAFSLDEVIHYSALAGGWLATLQVMVQDEYEGSQCNGLQINQKVYKENKNGILTLYTLGLCSTLEVLGFQEVMQPSRCLA